LVFAGLGATAAIAGPHRGRLQVIPAVLAVLVNEGGKGRLETIELAHAGSHPVRGGRDFVLDGVASGVAVVVEVRAGPLLRAIRPGQGLGARDLCVAGPDGTAILSDITLQVAPGERVLVDGDPEALQWAGRLAGQLGAMTLRVPPEGHTFYHAAAVMASNYVVALVDAAVMLMKGAGIGEETARRALAPLVEASSANALRQGPVEALTGPVQRGDVATLRMHMRALQAAPDRLRDLYAAAGLYALNIALRRGLAPQTAAAVEKVLQGYESEHANGD
jgi:hypothetical protein